MYPKQGILRIGLVNELLMDNSTAFRLEVLKGILDR